MNCQTFESLITDLTRERMMDASVRESAHSHAEACARCAVRLADEHTLTAGLRSLAAEMHTDAAPQRIEAALVSSFRAQRTAPPVSAAAAAAVDGARDIEGATTLTARQSKRWLPRRWATGTAAAAAAAAAVLLIFGFAGTRWRQTGQETGRPAAHVSASPAFTPSVGQAPIGRHPSQIASDLGTYATEIDPETAGAKEPDVPPAPVYVPRPSGATRGRPVKFQPTDVAQNAAQTSDEVNEIRSDFIPLTDGNSLAPGDGGQLLRVELPRSALVSFGLPMNAESAGERVKADVLMGEDGIARAIRFVR